jgi:hypothetical protein
MATIAALPSTLRDKLTSLSRRIRLLRALRGTSLLLLVLLLLGGSALLVDHFLTLPELVLRITLAGLVGIGVLATFVGLLLPLCRRLDPDALAAMIEEKYPHLGERLTTTVELAGGKDGYHGSAQLIALLTRETEAHATPLDFTRAFPSRTTSQIAAAAGVVLVLAVIPAFIWPDRYTELGSRLFLSWLPQDARSPADDAGQIAAKYTIHAEGGNVFILKDQPITLTAHFQRAGRSAVLPASCELICTDAAGTVTRVPMSAQPGESTRFFFKLDKVGSDFTYYIEAGDKRSASHQVSTVHSQIAIAPPEYVSKKYPPQPTLQFSTISLTLTSARPATRATLELSDRNGKQLGSRPVTLTTEGRAAHIDVPALDLGDVTSKVILEDGCSPNSVLTLPAWKVWRDEPPVFEQVSWKDDPKVSAVVATDVHGKIVAEKAAKSVAITHVPADQTVPVDALVTDRVGLGDVGVEYRTLDNPTIRFESIAQPQGTLEARIQHVFSLAGKVAEGGTIFYRLRATDNRNVVKAKFTDAAGKPVPAQDIRPNVVYFPARTTRDRWLSLTVNPSARRLEQQRLDQVRKLRELEIEEGAKTLDHHLRQILENLEQERSGLQSVRGDTSDEPKLSRAQARELAQVQKQNLQNKNALNELADKTENKPDFQAIAEQARAVAEKEMQQSEAALNRAARPQAKVSDRTQQLEKAEGQLDEAIRRVKQMRKDGEALARAGVDQLKLENVAERQDELAKRAAELAAKDPVKDPKIQNEVQKLQREQDDVARELKRLTEDSATLKQAIDAARADEARRLAEEARKLAEAQRDNDPLTNNALAELARKQSELAEKAAELARETRQPARTANSQPLRSEEAELAARALRKGDAAEAVWRQDQAARELERVGNDLSRAAELAKDPREAARQLARLQESLEKRLAEAMKARGDNQARRDQLKRLHQEQAAIHKAAEALPVPESKRDAVQDRKNAVDGAGRAAEALKRQMPQFAAPLMRQTKDALERLANRLPSLQQRQQQALQEVAQLKRQQDEIRRATEDAIAQADKNRSKSPQVEEELARRLADAARRQAEVAEKVSKLDPASQEARRDRAERSVNQALADLLDNRKADLRASQQKAQRELERLQQALAGAKPVDEKARELAARQQELAREAKERAADPKASAEAGRQIQRKQQQLAQEVRSLPPTEAPHRQATANEAVQKAEQAASAKPMSAEAQKQMERAAQALERLARQLNGEESRAARAEELAQRQAEAAAQVERLAKARPNGQQTAEGRRQQQQIAEEARQVRGGDEAQAEKQKAMDALAKAQQPTRADEQARVQREAADALRDLADRLAGRKDPVARAADLARDQRALANEAARANPRQPELARAQQAADRQADLSRQLKRLNARGAEAAAKQAAEQMAAAQKALDQAKTPAQAKGQLAKAAEATENLARALARANAQNPPTYGNRTQRTAAKPVAQPPRRAAQELARRQQQLARAMQQAENLAKNQKGDQAKQALERAMQRLGDEQRELSRRASQLPANQNQRALEQARQAMNRAEQAIGKTNPAEARQRQEEAARALQQLARQLPDQASRQAQRTAPQQPAALPQGVPNTQQARQAQQLARAQRDLQAEVRKALARAAQANNQVQNNTPAALAREQQEIARKTDELARNVVRQQGQAAKPAQQARQAAASTQQAAKQIQEGALPAAQKKGQEAAGQLRDLARQMEPSAPANPQGNNLAARAEQARQLADQQEGLNRRMQQAQQQNLQQQAGKLAQDLGKLAQELGRSPQAMNNASQGAQASQQAQAQMQQSQNQSRQGNQGFAKQSSEAAAKQLDRAAQQAEQAAQQLARASGQSQEGQPMQGQTQEGQPKQGQSQAQTNSTSEGQKAGEGVKQAQGQMSQAQNKLGQGQTQSAQASMKQAADSLQQAAQQLAKQGKSSGKPKENPISGEKGADGQGKADANPLAKGLEKYGAKRWGDLPGKLRTQILQDMKAKYGDDYARIIKLYFEQIADTKKKK